MRPLDAPAGLQSVADARADPIGLACGFGAALIWGAWPVISKIGTSQNLAPTDIAALRFAVAGLLLLPFFRKAVRAVVSWPLVLLMVLGAGVPYILFGIGGMSWQSVAHAAVISPSCSLLFSSVGASLLLGEPAGRRRWTAILMLSVGVVLVGAEGMHHGSSSSEGWIGDLMFCTSGFLWGIFTLSARKSGLPPLQAASLVAVISAIAYLPVYLAILPHSLSAIPQRILAEQAIFQGFFRRFLDSISMPTRLRAWAPAELRCSSDWFPRSRCCCRGSFLASIRDLKR